MPGIRRVGTGGLSWSVLAVWTVLAVVAAVVGRIAGAPDWLVMTAAAAAVVVPTVGGSLRTHLDQTKKDRIEARKRTAGASDVSVLVRDLSSRDVGVHPAIRQDVDYIERDIEQEIVSLLGLERRALIVGPSMSGKTRLALSAARAAVGDFVFYEPADGKSIREQLASGARFDRVLVWLDDVERFIAAGLGHADLVNLFQAGTVAVLGTIRTSEYDKLQTTSQIKPPGWDVPTWFGNPVWLTQWSEVELARLAGTRVGPTVLEDARKYGLSNYLGGAPQVERELSTGPTEHPTGYAIVRAVVDWRRVGMEQPMTHAVLAQVFSAYANLRHSQSANDQIKEGLSWALKRLNQTVALVTEEAAGFRALDLVMDRLTTENRPIPPELWATAIQSATRQELLELGWRAYEMDELRKAEAAWRSGAQAGDAEAMNNLGILLSDVLAPADVSTGRRWFEQAVEGGHPGAMVNLGIILSDNQNPPDIDASRRLFTRAADVGYAPAMVVLGELELRSFAIRRNRADEESRRILDEARRWFERGASAGFAPAMFALGLLHAEVLNPPDLRTAQRWYQKGAEAGHPGSMVNLAILLSDHDLDAALSWHQRAAEMGDTDAMVSLGYLYGYRVHPPDFAAARHWYEKAAEAGDIDAMFNLAAFLAQRQIPPDVHAARNWLEKATQARDTSIR